MTLASFDSVCDVRQLWNKIPLGIRDRLPLAFAVLVVAAVFVVAVKWERGDFDKSSPSGDSSSEQASESQPPETPPPLPLAAKENTYDGAYAFVKYYHEVSNYSRKASDVAPLASLYDLENCAGCQRVVDQVTESTTDGRYVKGGQYEVLEIIIDKYEQQFFAVVTYNRSASQVFDKEGEPAGSRSEAVDHGKGIMDLAYIDGQWKVTGLRPAHES